MTAVFDSFFRLFNLAKSDFQIVGQALLFAWLFEERSCL
jgi:hypothetical protein